MASKSVESPVLELHGAGITKPKPLRIIKRSKTISGSEASGEVLSRGRGSSYSSDQSTRSSPMGSDRPITIDGHSSEDVGSETTPKARSHVSKSTVAGAFLKSELQYPATTAGRYSARGSRNTSSSDFHNAVPFPRADLSFTKITDEPKTIERKLSRSKNFFLKAIGSLGDGSPEKTDRDSSGEVPRGGLIRRLSRSRSNKSVKSTHSGRRSRSGSASTPYKEPEAPYEIESRDITDASHDLRLMASRHIQSSGESSTRPLLGLRNHLILSPQVFVTPEEAIVDSGNCSFWVAIEISGVLRTADGCLREGNGYSRYSYGSVPTERSDSYGYLHSMKVEVLPSPNCFITQFIGDINHSLSIRAGETKLILARVSLGKIKAISGRSRPSADKLIADLETHLGDTHHPYLTVRLSYKHSGFLNDNRSTRLGDGASSHETHLQTDAVVAIQRHDSQSAWSPRNSQSMTSPVSSPLIDIIRQHFPEDEAEDAIVKLHTEQVAFPFAHRGGGGSSEETVKPQLEEAHTAGRNPAFFTPIQDLEASRAPMTRSRSVQNGVNPFARLPSRIESDSSAEECDPARKIWNEMRLTSRGRLSNNRLYNIDTDEYYSIDQDLTPTRTSSSAVTSSTLELDDNFSVSGNMMAGHRCESSIDQERNMIMEIALKNKRSLGAETLRSIAPSLAKGLGKSKASAVSGLGLGGGRTWGWNPPWW
ncbi:hypothetical protein HYFRA_00013734 [Hymenoscyphus fraxineus]|uniref:Uncharacterized protein n=1 Tax=Hymenoscyphus fraxineus TaxID=746836 RepID=A0A9N9PPG3_9HELO|nr:hypothetical protein HYFRA_00013734 [Hymenoscyphus fraxineus]